MFTHVDPVHLELLLPFTWGMTAFPHVNHAGFCLRGESDLPHVDLRLRAGMLVFTWSGAVYVGKSGLRGEPAPPRK